MNAELEQLTALSKQTLSELPDGLRDAIEAYVTTRLTAFHQALVARGQIKPIEPYSVTAHCTVDSNQSATQSR